MLSGCNYLVNKTENTDDITFDSVIIDTTKYKEINFEIRKSTYPVFHGFKDKSKEIELNRYLKSNFETYIESMLLAYHVDTLSNSYDCKWAKSYFEILNKKDSIISIVQYFVFSRDWGSRITNFDIKSGYVRNPLLYATKLLFCDIIYFITCLP